MKTLILALAMVAGSVVTMNQAQAALPATPVWVCTIHATSVHDNRFYVILKAGEVNATGTMKCTDLTGRSTSANVNIDIKELGIGAGFAFPAAQSKIDILEVKAGLSSPRGMYGKYALQAGVGVTLAGERLSVDGGVEGTPCNELAGKVQVKLEQLAGIGVDVTGSTMTISPASARR